MFHERRKLHFLLRIPFRWIFLALFLGLLGFILFVSRDLPTAETFAQRQVAQSTRIYDRTGSVLLYDLHGEQKRTVVALADISPQLVNATIVAEDDQFYHHIGVDIPGIIRSLFANVKEGRIAQGGSTITQQLVRGAVLSPEKTFARKIREIILALEIEARFSKNQILEAYLNQVPYGSLIYGVEAASQTYFGRSAKDLSLAQSAVLAALPQAPSYYSPYGSHREELLERKNYILLRMRELGYISEEERVRATQEEISFLPPRDAIRAPHFVFYVQEALERRFGKERVEQGGLKVVTTLDASLQDIAEHAVAEGANRNEKRFRGSNAALVAVNPKTGEILAMVGSRDYFDPTYDGNVNVTTRPRQPGSSFKPVVYAAAFKRGLTPDTILFDLPTEFGAGGKSYQPQNYTGKTYGPVTARQALANSLNIASVKMLWLAGVKETIDLAKQLGITTLTEPDRYGLSLVLGGGAVTLLEETSAFGVFGNDGVRVEPEAILRVETSNGEKLYEYQPKPTRAVDAEIARNINDILSDNDARTLVFGTQTLLTLGARPVAAKTGTAQDFRDAWTVGYTPSLAAGVWVGNNDYSPMRKGADGSVVAAPLWNAFMRLALENAPIERFVKPKPIVTGKPILDGNWAAEETIDIDRASGKRATDRTPQEWRTKQTYRTIHDTLYWVDKRAPRGPNPQNPQDDPQFAAWEEAVRTWVTNDPVLLTSVSQKPPDGFDDIHIPENVPAVTMLEPSDNSSFSSETLPIRALASAPLGVDVALLLIDGEPKGVLTKNPFSGYYEKTISKNVFSSSSDPHEILVRVFDVYGNRNEVSVSVYISHSEQQ